MAYRAHFKAKTKDSNEQPWEEWATINDPSTAKEEVEAIIDKFNNSLHKGEEPRELVEITRVIGITDNATSDDTDDDEDIENEEEFYDEEDDNDEEDEELGYHDYF